MVARVEDEAELGWGDDTTMQQKYLITLQHDADLKQFLARASAIGCGAAPNSQPVPMSDGECVVTLEGPTESFPLLAELPDVRKVSRSSNLHLY